MDGSLCKILGPGPAGPRIDVHPTPYVATEHRHVRQDSLFFATVIFYGETSNKMTCSKFWPHVIRGPLSSRGPYARAYRA